MERTSLLIVQWVLWWPHRWNQQRRRRGKRRRKGERAHSWNNEKWREHELFKIFRTLKIGDLYCFNGLCFSLFRSIYYYSYSWYDADCWCLWWYCTGYRTICQTQTEKKWNEFNEIKTFSEMWVKAQHGRNNVCFTHSYPFLPQLHTDCDHQRRLPLLFFFFFAFPLPFQCHLSK